MNRKRYTHAKCLCGDPECPKHGKPTYTAWEKFQARAIGITPADYRAWGQGERDYKKALRRAERLYPDREAVLAAKAKAEADFYELKDSIGLIELDWEEQWRAEEEEEQKAARARVLRLEEDDI